MGPCPRMSSVRSRTSCCLSAPERGVASSRSAWLSSCCTAGPSSPSSEPASESCGPSSAITRWWIRRRNASSCSVRSALGTWPSRRRSNRLTSRLPLDGSTRAAAHDFDELVDGAGEARALVLEDRGNPLVDRLRDEHVGREAHRDLHPERSLDVSDGEVHLGVGTVEDEEDPALVDADQPERVQADARVL